MISASTTIAVYLLASARNGTLYIGVTSALEQRIADHRDGRFEGFAKRYGCRRLVWFEPHEDMQVAIQRETSLKRWRRAWKLALIEQDNPEWRDLADPWFEDTSGLLDTMR